MKEELIIKIFVPDDQTADLGDYLINEIDRLCKEFLAENPELEEVSRKIESASVDKINACYRTSFSVRVGACVFRKKNN